MKAKGTQVLVNYGLVYTVYTVTQKNIPSFGAWQCHTSGSARTPIYKRNPD